MSAPAATAAAMPAPDAPKRKGKSMLLIIVAALVLAGGGAGGWFYMNKKNHAAGEEEAAAHAPEHAAAPTYLALENMVVNLADPGGERFAQIGVTLDLENEKVGDKIKTYLPAIRSSVLMLVSQRTSEELLKRDGKEKLAADIVTEVSRTLGYEVEAPVKKSKVAESDDDEAPVKPKKRRKADPSPINGVLFSSFIVQ
ncbi:hypothetical protein BH11PSE13_BH11PSE13_10340 [soil metagenome]